MQPELQNYIAQCRSLGMSDQAIRAQLVQSGWTEELLASAWPLPATPAAPAPIAPPILTPVKAVEQPLSAVPVTSAVPASMQAAPMGAQLAGNTQIPLQTGMHRPKRVGLLIGSVVGIAVIVSGTLVALGESGYAPTVSKVYRSTGLPIAWEGTTSKPSINIGRALLATLDEKKIKVTTTAEGTVSDINNEAAAKIGLKPLKQNEGTVHAAVSEPGVTKFSGSFAASFDEDKGIRMEYGFKLPSDDPIRAMAEGYIKPSFEDITLESILPISGKAVFARTNILPTPTEADKGRWFAMDLPGEDDLKEMREEIKKDILEEDEKARKDLGIMVDTTTKDMGVVRHKGEVMAMYRTTLTSEVLRTLSNNAELQTETREALKSYADEWKGGNMTIDWYMDARNPRLKELVYTLDVHTDYANTQARGAMTYEYGAAAELTIPDRDSAWDFEAYMQAVAENSSNLYDTGAFTQEAIDMVVSGEGLGYSSGAQYRAQNSIRKNDVTQLAKTIEFYRVDHEDALPADTKGEYVPLDVEDSVLAQNADFAELITLPMFDPLPDDYYYSYWSQDGSYRVAAVLVDEETGEQTGFYLIEDAVAVGEVDELP
ncbi:MAG TPA: hypothetical protein VLA04_03900 [Verrucomicrobiae bacterium]|nr:hypothetical protein [Verrucomicrobiae bacterium]